jgi:hypothetical protein
VSGKAGKNIDMKGVLFYGLPPGLFPPGRSEEGHSGKAAQRKRAAGTFPSLPPVFYLVIS